MWGTTGIGYNVKAVRDILGPDAAIDSWDNVFEPEKIAKFKDCGIHLLDSSDDIMPAGAELSASRSEFERSGRSAKRPPTC